METLILGGLGALVLIALFAWFSRKQESTQHDEFTGNAGHDEFVELPTAVRPMSNSAPAYVPTRADLEQEVRAMLATGAKIEAVKLVRERTSLGLKEAKDLVDAIESGASPSIGSLAFGNSRADATTDVAAEVRRLIAARKIVDAIKLVRERTGLGLKEAKDYVTRL
jgi:ribosomal protein L7/L12